jgi:hypothetical protein
MAALSTIHDVTGRRLISSIYPWDIYGAHLLIILGTTVTVGKVVKLPLNIMTVEQLKWKMEEIENYLLYCMWQLEWLKILLLGIQFTQVQRYWSSTLKWHFRQKFTTIHGANKCLASQVTIRISVLNTCELKNWILQLAELHKTYIQARVKQPTCNTRIEGESQGKEINNIDIKIGNKAGRKDEGIRKVGWRKQIN